MYFKREALCFELGFGAMRGSTLDEMLADYDVLGGRRWPPVSSARRVEPARAPQEP